MGDFLIPPPRNPVSRILAGLLTALALVGAFFFGFFVLALAIGLGGLAWLLIALRMWWLRRRWQQHGISVGLHKARPPGSAEQVRTDVIDADYEVVSRHEDE